MTGQGDQGNGKARTPAVLASFQPARRCILVIVAGGDPAGVELSLDEARGIHGALTGALALADAVEAPVAAMG